jgi:hypothetical protein
MRNLDEYLQEIEGTRLPPLRKDLENLEKLDKTGDYIERVRSIVAAYEAMIRDLKKRMAPAGP